MLVKAIDTMPRWTGIWNKLQVVARASTKHRQIFPRSIDRNLHTLRDSITHKQQKPSKQVDHDTNSILFLECISIQKTHSCRELRLRSSERTRCDKPTFAIHHCRHVVTCWCW
ncbi:hypothetical protein F441_10011 [Phytophthora nicotianae CJ01A1]|uniref:Uncharacterized protein n=5 Tax=Phytophthora nicotianae TaxID=4792 RepID=W2R7F6_PHYN3|nr:hypothetical protein PPTG_21077 [Phytophthora nicotianae INRA-310]ETL38729.1 hypothetical protein L916_09769 [Phytophthora nicotianae]ETO73982.1 hypothetical protein F444_10166 [Phytophthora nicotianae P1976]ETP15156.1 hypothetical protein F441_10011 [Phytophthora nicotianae CJ01A1]ETP43210.1 hypothetical protein F442_09976 [Phytophthora nicotianae P10297]ETL91858.1 hypothetical protein L917_09689 [Phytophthora nicotianae]